MNSASATTSHASGGNAGAGASPRAPAPPGSSAGSGALAATLGYFLWGLVPLYWTQLAQIGALELIAHRHVWSLAFLVVLLALRRDFREVRGALATPRRVAINFCSASFLTINWLVYVWGVNSGYVIDCSLGYFLVPLVNVATGRFLLHERLRRAQWIAIAFAAVGVALMIVQLGRPPWIALALATSWGAYSLMRKQSPLGSLAGLTTETLLLTPFALAFLWWLHRTGAGALGGVDVSTHVLLVAAGVVTAVPLLLFAFGARRIRMSTLGLLQYIAPTVQLGLGVWVYREPFSASRAASFALIWVGLALYTFDNLLAQRRPAVATPTPPGA
jgi:chloramphenicol-sensitive protein RarD